MYSNGPYVPDPWNGCTLYLQGKTECGNYRTISGIRSAPLELGHVCLDRRGHLQRTYIASSKTCRLTKAVEKIGTVRWDDTVKSHFRKLGRISIDCVAMEKSHNIRYVVGAFSCKDAGNWMAIKRFFYHAMRAAITVRTPLKRRMPRIMWCFAKI